MHYKETSYGFEYGSARITRSCSDYKKGWAVLSIKTPKGVFDIYVTKTGKVRFHSKDGEWLPFQPKDKCSHEFISSASGYKCRKCGVLG